MASRNTGHPDREIFNLYSALNEELNRHPVGGLYAGRLRSRRQDFEGIKRKWEVFTGIPVPTDLKTAQLDHPLKTQPTEDEYDKGATKVSEDQTPVVDSAQPATAEIAEPPSEIIDLGNMNYNDIRRELKKRGLDTKGKKVDLQQRLRQHLDETRMRREKTIAKKNALLEEKLSDNCEDDVQDGDDIVMDDIEMNKQADHVSVEEICGKNDNIDSDNGNTAKPISSKVSPAPKSALKASKYAVTSLPNSTVSASDAVISIDEDTDDDSAKKTNGSSSKASSGSDSSISNMSSVVKKSFAPTHTTPSAKTTNGGSIGGSAKLLEKKRAMAEATEARKAKIAEMREKAKIGIASGGSGTNSITSNTSMSAKFKTFPKSSNSSKTNILLKMREKVAAEKATIPTFQSTIQKPSQSVKPSVSTASSSTVSSSTKQTTSQIKSSHKATALKNILDPANKVPPAKAQEKLLSPMQTYEMSEHEEEDSDSEDESDAEETKEKKSIPEWAQRANLHRALERQFADGPNRMDPDRIFGEVLTCNLEEIFGDVKTKKRYHKRTSSGNWTKDHVTIAEKLAYKRTMGYDKM